MSFLERFVAEILIRQVSFKQKCDMYNYYNKYERIKKTRAKHSQQEDLCEDDGNEENCK